MKSTLFNMVMVLFVITLLASAGVGAVHMITEEPIAEARVKATREALKQVLPEFDETEDTALTVENLPVTVHTASEKGRVVGYAVESMTKNGFSGVICGEKSLRGIFRWRSWERWPCSSFWSASDRVCTVKRCGSSRCSICLQAEPFWVPFTWLPTIRLRR